MVFKNIANFFTSTSSISEFSSLELEIPYLDYINPASGVEVWEKNKLDEILPVPKSSKVTIKKVKSIKKGFSYQLKRQFIVHDCQIEKKSIYLDTFILLPKKHGQQIPVEERRMLIQCYGPDQPLYKVYEKFEQERIYREEKGIPFDHGMMGLNARGVGYSHVKDGKKLEKFSWEVLADDVIAVVNHLLKEGYKAENLLLQGVSTGGVMATLAAAKLHQQRKRVSLILFGSLASFSKYIQLHGGLESLSKDNIRAIISHTGLTEWDLKLDLVQVYLSIPSCYRTALHIEGDTLIPESIALFYQYLQWVKSHPVNDMERNAAQQVEANVLLPLKEEKKDGGRIELDIFQDKLDSHTLPLSKLRVKKNQKLTGYELIAQLQEKLFKAAQNENQHLKEQQTEKSNALVKLLTF